MDSPRDQVEKTLRGDQVEEVPLTAVRGRVVFSDAERQLRNAALSLLANAPPPWKVSSPGVGVERVFLHQENGDTATAMASSKLLLAAVIDRVVLCPLSAPTFVPTEKDTRNMTTK